MLQSDQNIGRPAEYPREAVIAAGKELEAASRNITGFALRQKVGGGNAARLKQIWDEYQTSQSITTTEPVAELPVELAEEVASATKTLTDRISNLARELNDKAVRAAERRVASIVREAGDQREQAERELADASITVDDLEAKLDEARTEGLESEKHLTDALATNQAQAVELAKLRERLDLMEQAAKIAIEQHAGEVSRLHEELSAVRSDLSKESTRAERADAKVASIQVELDKATEELTKLKREHAENQKLLATAVSEGDGAKAALTKAIATSEAQAEAHSNQRNAAAKELLKQTEQRDKAIQEASAAREHAAELAGKLAAIQEQNAALLTRLVPGDSVPAKQ